MRTSVIAIGLLALAAQNAHASANVGFVPGDPGSTSQRLQLEVVWEASDVEIDQVRTWRPVDGHGPDVYQGDDVTCAVRDTIIACDMLFDRNGKASQPVGLLIDDQVQRSADFGGSDMTNPTWKHGSWSFSLPDQSAMLLGAWIGGAKKPLARCKLSPSAGVVDSAACTFKINKTGKLTAK